VEGRFTRCVCRQERLDPELLKGDVMGCADRGDRGEEAQVDVVGAIPALQR
jgi:hypothetical protein